MMDDAPCLKTPDTTAGMMNRRNAQIPGDCGSYFWKNLCIVCIEWVNRKYMSVEGTFKEGRMSDVPELR